MKRPITLAVNQHQFKCLQHAIKERIRQNENEVKAGWVSDATIDLIEEEKSQLENLLTQLDNEFNRMFK